ncbi:MAG: ATP synthase F1 subunit delta, partial [Chloroflexota bacterium]
LTRTSARRYAEAAFEIATRDDSMDGWLAAFAIAEERLTGPEVIRLLSNPAVTTASRVEVLGRVLGDDVSGAPRSLFALMVRRGRFELVPAVIREFTRLYRIQEGIVEANVTSAVSLDAKTQEAIRERLVAITGSQVEMRLEVDPQLLGGVQVRLGDELIDGSVRGRLERMRIAITTTAI